MDKRTWAEKADLPKIHSSDFRPDLKQDWGFYDIYFMNYLRPEQVVRVRMPTRYAELETNGKYMPYIHSIVISKIKERDNV